MSQPNLTASDSITFPEAIALTQRLLEQMEAGISEEEIERSVASLVKSENGARGFFVAYLTSDRPLADCPSSAIMRALRSSPEIVGELLVKNVAMSAAMEVTHRRNHDQSMVQSSHKTCQRSASLMSQLQINTIASKLEQLHESITTGRGNYQAFLHRWSYDTEQQQAILNALPDV